MLMSEKMISPCRLFITAMMIMVGLSVSAAPRLAKVTVMEQPYYVYQVKGGDTMYGLSKQFGWDVTVLGQYNPWTLSSLDKGCLIYYPAQDGYITQGTVSKVDKGSQSATKSTAENTPLRHKVARGETLSGISRMYGVSLNDLYRLNPGSRNGIKADEWIIISQDNNNGKGGSKDNVNYHTILAGETLYGVAHANNVSVEALMRANPGISDRHFRAGDVIRIPAPGTGISMQKQDVTVEVVNSFKNYKVKKEDTWQSVASQFGVPVDVLKAANHGFEFKNKKYIGIPVMGTTTVEQESVYVDPRESSSEGLQQIYEEVHGIIADNDEGRLRVAMLVDDPSAKRDREFMRGFLTGVDRLKNTGVKLNLKLIDGNIAASDIEGQLEAFKPDVIITNQEQNMPIWLSEYARTSTTPLINTLDIKDESFQNNPYVVQLIPGPEYFNEEIAGWLKREYDGYTLVFVGEEDNNDALATSLKSVWDPNHVRDRSVEDLKTMPLASTGKYLLYAFPVKKSEVTDFLNAVDEATTKVPMAYVSVVGRPNWIVYDESLKEKFQNAGVMIPSRFYMNPDDSRTQGFTMAYRQLFDRQPAKGFPVYAASGFDVASYFISNLYKNGGDINGLPESTNTIQSDFSLKRPTNWSGLLNRGVYMVKFTPFNTVEKIVIQ